MIRIEVNETDIKRGVRQSDEDCAIARAIKRFIRENKLKGWVVLVGIKTIDFYYVEGPNITVAIPKSVQKFIDKFDDADNFPKSTLKPFGFSIKGVSVRKNSLVVT